VWHGGLSGSAPLKVTDLAGLSEILGVTLAEQLGAIGFDQTVFSTRNLLVTGSVLILVPLILALMVPKDPGTFVPAPMRKGGALQPPAEELQGRGVAHFLESGPWFSLAMGGLMLIWLVPWLLQGDLWKLNPNSMNFIFLTVGLLLAGSPKKYMQMAEGAAKACAGIIVQFPLYGGILGLLVVGGFVQILVDLMPASEGLLSLSTFLSAGMVNLFVPSGGGQWALQGPVVMQASIDAGADPGRIVMALAWGDQWTNLFQPFWALPLLGITETKAGDILGYTFVLGIVVGIVFGLGAVIL